jgi:hypothetical protein
VDEPFAKDQRPYLSPIVLLSEQVKMPHDSLFGKAVAPKPLQQRYFFPFLSF